MSNEVLTVSNAVRLCELLSAVQRGAKVGYLNTREEVEAGVLRGITDERGNFWPTHFDVRDARVWITTEKGFELFKPVREILEAMRCLQFSLNY